MLRVEVGHNFILGSIMPVLLMQINGDPAVGQGALRRGLTPFAGRP
jgi:hypothetical protein